MNIKVAHSLHKKDLLLKYQEHKQRENELQQEAFREAQRLAALLVEEFSVDRVYLIGPLAYNKFSPGMKLELAAEGILAGMYPKASAYLKHKSTFEVDLIDLHQTDAWTKRSVQDKGKLLAKKLS